MRMVHFAVLYLLIALKELTIILFEVFLPINLLKDSSMTKYIPFIRRETLLLYILEKLQPNRNRLH